MTYLNHVVGLKVSRHFRVPGEGLTILMGWPESDGAEVWMLGEGSSGLVEVVGIPESLQDRVFPEMLVSFSTPHLHATVSASRRHGVEVSDVAQVEADGMVLEASIGRVADLRFELLRFSSDPATVSPATETAIETQS